MNTHTSNDLIIERVSKQYKTGNKEPVQALSDISLKVEDGELFGLIGADGAGKTTLFRIIATLLLPDSGTVRVCGYDVLNDMQAIRNIVGYMPGKFSLYQDLSVEENLRFFAAVFGTTVEANYGLIKDIYEQIAPFKTRRAGKLSGGMKQKLALCCALIHRPRLLLLDEPTTGVDSVSRQEFWEMLRRLKKEGITIVVSTPYMDEASLCQRIALIQGGKLLGINTPQGIIKGYGERLYAVKATEMGVLLRTLSSCPKVSSANAFGEYHHITLATGATIDEVVQYAETQGLQGVAAKEITPTVEDCFMKLMRQA